MPPLKDQLLPIRSLFGVLSQHDTRAAAVLQEAFSGSLERYAVGLYRRPIAVSAPPRRAARTLLLASFRDQVARQVGPDHAIAASQELAAHTTLQTGPHAQLLLDRDCLSATVCTYLGLRAAHYRYMPVFAGCTMKFAVARQTGPGILQLGGQAINVFGLSRNAMDRDSLLARRGTYRFNLTCGGELGPMAHAVVSDLYNRAEGIETAFAMDAFDGLNRRLWHVWDNAAQVTPIWFDERFVSVLVADHLREKEGLLPRLLSDPRWCERTLSALHRAAEGPAQLLFPKGTDFFWGVGSSHIHSLRYREGYLEKATGPKAAPIPMSANVLVQHLEDGTIAPAPFLVFVVLSFLPGIRALGGPFQLAYLPEMKRAFLGALDTACPEQDALRHEILEDELSAWGLPVIEDQTDVADLIAHCGAEGLLDTLSASYGAMSFAEATRDLERFRKYPRWRNMARSYGYA